MGVHGAAGTRGAGTPSLPLALQAAAAGCCAPPTPPQEPQGEAQQRPPVRGGGPSGHPHHHASGQRLAHELGGGRLEHAARHACQPTILPPAIAILGGGPAAPAATCPPGAPVITDPALAALAAWTGEPLAERPSLLRQLANQVAQLQGLLGAGIDRLARLLPARDGGADATLAGDQPAAAAPRAEVPAPPALQPPPPPPMGPTFTLDPRTGTIDVADGAQPAHPGDGVGDAPHREPDPAPPIEIGIPTSWMPFIARLRPSSLRRDLRGLLERLDALLAETGVSRLQLLLAMVAVPLATAFLIDVVMTIVDGR